MYTLDIPDRVTLAHLYELTLAKGGAMLRQAKRSKDAQTIAQAGTLLGLAELMQDMLNAADAHADSPAAQAPAGMTLVTPPPASKRG